MREQPTSEPVTVTRDGICIVDGYGIRIRVERGHLVIADGTGPARRENRFSRPLAGIRRLVLIGHTGYVTLESLRWMGDVGIGFIHLGPDGRVLATSASPGPDEPALRRAQAKAWGTAGGLDIARRLLREKLSGQAAVVTRLAGGDAVAERIESLAPLLETAPDQHALMVVEAAAAAEYWQGWSGLPIAWARRDIDRVPEHWRVFTARASPLTARPRRAADPVNALINYIQALVEAEARLACLAMGLDPGLGVLHADQRARDSLCLDVQEIVRPAADAYVLEFLTHNTLRASDFAEQRDGTVRILPPLSTWLAGSVDRWRRLMAPVVERLAADFAALATSRVRRVATRLTETNRSAGRPTGLRVSSRSAPAPRRRACVECGAAVAAHRKYCADCLPAQRARLDARFLDRLRERQRELHRSGRHPSHSDGAQRRRGEANARHGRARHAWEQANPSGSDVLVYRSEILPRLRDVSISQLASATGLSAGYRSAIRKGERTPHPRWWETLRGL